MTLLCRLLFTGILLIDLVATGLHFPHSYLSILDMNLVLLFFCSFTLVYALPTTPEKVSIDDKVSKSDKQTSDKKSEDGFVPEIILAPASTEDHIEPEPATEQNDGYRGIGNILTNGQYPTFVSVSNGAIGLKPLSSFRGQFIDRQKFLELLRNGYRTIPSAYKPSVPWYQRNARMSPKSYVSPDQNVNLGYESNNWQNGAGGAVDYSKGAGVSNVQAQQPYGQYGSRLTRQGMSNILPNAEYGYGGQSNGVRMAGNLGGLGQTNVGGWNGQSGQQLGSWNLGNLGIQPTTQSVGQGGQGISNNWEQLGNSGWNQLGLGQNSGGQQSLLGLGQGSRGQQIGGWGQTGLGQQTVVGLGQNAGGQQGTNWGQLGQQTIMGLGQKGNGQQGGWGQAGSGQQTVLGLGQGTNGLQGGWGQTLVSAGGQNLGQLGGQFAGLPNGQQIGSTTWGQVGNQALPNGQQIGSTTWGQGGNQALPNGQQIGSTTWGQGGNQAVTWGQIGQGGGSVGQGQYGLSGLTTFGGQGGQQQTVTPWGQGISPQPFVQPTINSGIGLGALGGGRTNVGTSQGAYGLGQQGNTGIGQGGYLSGQTIYGSGQVGSPYSLGTQWPQPTQRLSPEDQAVQQVLNLINKPGTQILGANMNLPQGQGLSTSISLSDLYQGLGNYQSVMQAAGTEAYDPNLTAQQLSTPRYGAVTTPRYASTTQKPHHGKNGLNEVFTPVDGGSFGGGGEDSTTAVGALVQQIRRLPAVAYSQMDCEECRKSEEILKDIYGIPLVVFYLDRIPNTQTMINLLKKVTGKETLPQFFLCGHYIGGHENILHYYENGQIPNLLRRCLDDKSDPNAFLYRR